MTTVKKTGSGRYYACNKKYSIRKKQSTHYGWSELFGVTQEDFGEDDD